MAKLPAYMTASTGGRDDSGNLVVNVTIHRDHPAWWLKAARLVARHVPVRHWLTAYRVLVRTPHRRA